MSLAWIYGLQQQELVRVDSWQSTLELRVRHISAFGMLVLIEISRGLKKLG